MSDDLRFLSYLKDLRTIASRLDSMSDIDKQAMKNSPMFPAFRDDVAADTLLRAEQVLISDWPGRDFAGNVYIAPTDNTLESKCPSSGVHYQITYNVYVAPKDDILESMCASSGVRYQITHLSCRDVPRDGFRVSGDVCAACCHRWRHCRA